MQYSGQKAENIETYVFNKITAKGSSTVNISQSENTFPEKYLIIYVSLQILNC